MSTVEPTIFVSVASFCDPLLLHTIRDGVSKAAHPERLVWGVVDQNSEDRREELQSSTSVSKLRYLQVHPAQSRGVCWARSVVGSLYAGEDYFLQIDSHMFFEPGWDTTLLEQIVELGLRSAKPILSIYPYGFVFEDGKPVVKERIDPEAALVFRVSETSKLSAEQTTLMFKAVPVAASEPVEGFHVAGGFLFAPGAFVQELPYDPRLYFHGEEQSLALRAYTRGWDIFHPVRIPLYHHYNAPGQSHHTQHWQPHWEAQRDFRFEDLSHSAQERLRCLVDGDQTLGVYGPGSVRSLISFATASGIDYPHRRLMPPLGPATAGSPADDEMVHVVELNPYHPRPFVFTDCARSLVESLRDMGIRAQLVVNALPYKGRLLIMGWSPEWLTTNQGVVDRARTILFNAEQLGSNSPVATRQYVEAMRGWVVADFHEANVDHLQRHLGPEVQAVELPIAPHPVLGLRPSVAGVAGPAADVVFIGSINERRRQQLQELASSGLKVLEVNGAYGLELMNVLQRSRLLVHIHYYDTRLFPVLRMLRPVMMGLPVVCESSVFSARNDWTTSGMHFCDAADLTRTCQALLADPARLRSSATACRHHARSVSMAEAWEQLMRATHR